MRCAEIGFQLLQSNAQIARIWRRFVEREYIYDDRV